MKSWLEKSTIEMYSTHNKGETVVTERFIKTLKNKLYKYMTSVPKSIYIDKLDVIGNKCNNTYHSIIKVTPFDVNINKYINFSKDINYSLHFSPFYQHNHSSNQDIE